MKFGDRDYTPVLRQQLHISTHGKRAINTKLGMHIQGAAK